jgi:hypothetical protein
VQKKLGKLIFFLFAAFLLFSIVASSPAELKRLTLKAAEAGSVINNGLEAAVSSLSDASLPLARIFVWTALTRANFSVGRDILSSNTYRGPPAVSP